jgi:sulfatase modifying factor 1
MRSKLLGTIGAVVMVSACAASVKQSPPKEEPPVLMPVQTTCSETSCPIKKPQETSDVKDVASPVIEEKCLEGMAWVKGEYCPKPNHDLPQYDETGTGDPQCKTWMEKPCNLGGTKPTCLFARCAEYKETSSICLAPTIYKSFCMDKYEYTKPGDTKPLTMINFRQAEKIAKDNGKRLCYETEFEFACSGEKDYPYSTGYTRPDGICNIDQTKNIVALSLNPYNHRMEARVNPALVVASDSMPDCKSDAGVYMLNGNVDEITIRDRSPAPGNTKEKGSHNNSLKGGWLGGVRNRCRPATTAHDDGFYNTSTGTRLCSDTTQ